jgi:hypothetical protein
VRICAVLQYAFLVEFLPLYAQSCWTISPVAPDRTYLACRGGASSTNSKTSAAVYLDYSKNRTTGQTMERLLELAEGSGLHAHIAMFRGEKINRAEDRAVLHVALHLRRLRRSLRLRRC